MKQEFLKNKKYAIITGCASGIGLEIADKLHSEGIVVYGLDIMKITKPYLTFICDVSDEISVKKVIHEIQKQTDRIDYLVNVAGLLTVGKPLKLIDTPIKQWDAIMRINLKSVLIMIKNAYPLYVKSSIASIVNISSEQSLFPEIGFAPYAVSKCGINMLTMCAAQEFIDNGIRVNAIALGTVKTNILDSLNLSKIEQEKMFADRGHVIPLGLMKTVDVYNVVKFLLVTDSKYITGMTILCDGGMHLI